MNTEKEEKAPKKSKISKRFLIVLIILVSTIGSYAGYLYVYSLSHESTDNAQIKADITPIIPHVSGYIKEIRVTDNQYVKKGDTLLIIDSIEYVLRLNEAKAALAIAESNLAVSKENVAFSLTQVYTADASVSGAETSIESAEIRVRRADQDFERYSNLLKDKVITQQEYDKAEAEKQTAEKQLELLKKQKEIASRQKGSTSTQSKVIESQIKVAQATIDQRKAAVDEAALNLSYCVILAPSDGQVSTVNLVNGQLVMSGQSLFNLVLTTKLWVVANFKETQITKMLVGQKAAIEIDAFPDKEFKGIVRSISPGTGATFTLLPPDNATGNFVKVVQRVPVKIELEAENPEDLKRLRPGLSVDVTVTTK